MPDTAGFLAAVAGDDTITITDQLGNTWSALVIAVQPDADHDLLVQETGTNMLSLYSVVGTELNLHIEGKGDF